MCGEEKWYLFFFLQVGKWGAEKRRSSSSKLLLKSCFHSQISLISQGNRHLNIFLDLPISRLLSNSQEVHDRLPLQTSVIQILTYFPDYPCLSCREVIPSFFCIIFLWNKDERKASVVFLAQIISGSKRRKENKELLYIPFFLFYSIFNFHTVIKMLIFFFCWCVCLNMADPFLTVIWPKASGQSFVSG